MNDLDDHWVNVLREHREKELHRSSDVYNPQNATIHPHANCPLNKSCILLNAALKAGSLNNTGYRAKIFASRIVSANSTAVFAYLPNRIRFPKYGRLFYLIGFSKFMWGFRRLNRYYTAHVSPAPRGGLPPPHRPLPQTETELFLPGRRGEVES
ncbi:hypothetical protein Trydic_g23321 [Trypoxylus dichotomus]